MPLRKAPPQAEAGLLTARQKAVIEAVRQVGLLGTKEHVGGRIPTALLKAAKRRSGIGTDTELLVYALAKVAIEDDYAEMLLALEGTVSKDLNLEV
jgi:hypothetical protein